MSDFHFLSIDQEDTNLKPSFIEKSICFLGTIARQKSLENNAMLIIKFFFFSGTVHVGQPLLRVFACTLTIC